MMSWPEMCFAGAQVVPDHPPPRMSQSPAAAFTTSTCCRSNAGEANGDGLSRIGEFGFNLKSAGSSVGGFLPRIILPAYFNLDQIVSDIAGEFVMPSF
jgi:hypothetical protein